MKLLIKLTLLYLTLTFISCREICYDDLACFTDSDPFGGTYARPISALPESPETINTKFTLYTPRVNTDDQLLTTSEFNTNFNHSLPTKFIVHGFFNTPFLNGWIRELKDTLLENEATNVIVVDWGGGSFRFYTMATANTQVVGAQIARLIEMLVEKTGVKVGSFHCIGHSLGAHVCGYAGKRIKGMGRITGMDPAAPYFEHTPPIVRLDKGDAVFVDIIHTDTNKHVANTSSIGILNPIGHVDFYPNEGKSQPGCEITSGNIKPHCSHTSSHKIFRNSILNKCPLIAYPCSSYDKFSSGDCLKCGLKGCNRMGYYASLNNDLDSLYLNTQPADSEYVCKHYHQVILKSEESGDMQAKGSFTVYFKTLSETSSTETIDNGNIVFTSESIEKRLVSIEQPLKNALIVGAFITYKRGWNPADYYWYESNWMFKSVVVFSADHQVAVELCPIKSMFGEDNTIEYIKC